MSRSSTPSGEDASAVETAPERPAATKSARAAAQSQTPPGALALLPKITLVSLCLPSPRWGGDKARSSFRVAQVERPVARVASVDLLRQMAQRIGRHLRPIDALGGGE